MKTLYVALIAQRFDACKFVGIPFAISVPEGEPQRFLPVFESRQEAEAWSEGKYAIIELNENT